MIDSEASFWGWFNWSTIFLFIKGTMFFFFRNRSDLMRFWFFSDYINQLFKVPIVYLRLWPRCPFCWVFFFWNPWKWLECRSIVSWRKFSSLDGSLIGSFVIPPFVHWKRKFLLYIIILCRYSFLDPFGMMNILDVWCCLFGGWFMLIPCLLSIPNPHSSGFFLV